MSKCLDPGGLVWCDFVEVWAPPSISQTVGIWLPVEKNQKLCCAHQAWLQVGLRLWQPFFPFEATGLTRCRLRNFCDCRRARGGHSFVHSPHSFQFKSFYRAVKWESGLPPHRHTYTHTYTHTHSSLSKWQVGLPNVHLSLQLEDLRTSMANAAHRGRDEPWSSMLPASASVNLQNVTCIFIRIYFCLILA